MDLNTEQSTILSTNLALERYRWVVAALFLCLLPLCFIGYGSDNDTYGVVQCGVSTWHLHIPSTSRNPGYWTYEALVYVLSTLGGYVLSNLMSLAVASIVVWRFYTLAARLRIAYPILLAGCLIVTPVFAIAATSTMDYVWSLLCIVLAAEMLLANRLIPASLLGALAISFRGANSVVVAGGFAAAIAYEIYVQRRITPFSIKLALSGIVAALLGCLTYIMSYRVAGNSMSFTAPMIGPAAMWTTKMHLGRFVYKGMYLLGPAAMIVLGVAAFQYIRDRRLGIVTSGRSTPSRLTVLLWGFFLADVALFLKFPVEISYLIPAAFFFFLLAGATLFQRSRTLAVALFVSILSLNFVLPEFAQPNISGQATSAHLKLALVPGTLIQDIKSRRLLIHCKDAACWDQLHGKHPHQ